MYVEPCYQIWEKHLNVFAIFFWKQNFILTDLTKKVKKIKLHFYT